jgi:hypothetical protein
MATSFEGRRCAARCEGGRCQLLALHLGPHAALIDDAYLTWTADNTPFRWSRGRPPDWLIDLPWFPGAHPTMRQASDG